MSSAVKPIPLYRFIKILIKRFIDDDVMGLSAQLAFFFLLSLFPFLLFTMTLLSYLPISVGDVLDIVNKYAPGEAMKVIETNLRAILDVHRGGLLSVGIIVTIWSASNGINAVIRALNTAYDVSESRPFLLARLMAILLTVAMIVVIIIALLLPVFGEAIGIFVFSHFGLSHPFLMVWNTVRWILSFLVIISVFACLYYFAPNKRLPFKEVVVGAFFATLGWQVVSLAFSYYVTNFGNFTAMYGSIGGIIILMFWFYLSAMILIFGGIINATIYKLKHQQ
jgi:membrane protein